MERELLYYTLLDIKRKMVFISGPRQVGKTTLGKQILKKVSYRNQLYLNWDLPEHRKIIRELNWDRSAPVVLLDEIHKYSRWKSLLKGFYDTEGKKQHIIVTGSARLDIYRKGGDSLLGRYNRFRLHPFTLGELIRRGKHPLKKNLINPGLWLDNTCIDKKLQDDLLKKGGFPEPFLKLSLRSIKRWRLQRREQILKEDLRDISMVRDITLIEQLVDLLEERTGGLISINNLAHDLEVDNKTVANWMNILESLYIIFRVRPYSGKLSRTIRKEYKIYFWDWSTCKTPGALFENFAASHLLKFCHWLEDVEGIPVKLRFVRDREKREVDFLLIKDNKPWVLLEAKLKPGSMKHLNYFQPRLKAPYAYQITSSTETFNNIIPATRIFAGLP